jgi:hypothetical protein
VDEMPFPLAEFVSTAKAFGPTKIMPTSAKIGTITKSGIRCFCLVCSSLDLYRA